jgi:hypothetical protein
MKAIRPAAKETASIGHRTRDPVNGRVHIWSRHIPRGWGNAYWRDYWRRAPRRHTDRRRNNRGDIVNRGAARRRRSNRGNNGSRRDTCRGRPSRRNHRRRRTRGRGASSSGLRLSKMAVYSNRGGQQNYHLDNLSSWVHLDNVLKIKV